MIRSAISEVPRSPSAVSFSTRCSAPAGTKSFASATTGCCWGSSFSCRSARTVTSVFRRCGGFTRNGERKVAVRIAARASWRPNSSPSSPAGFQAGKSRWLATVPMSGSISCGAGKPMSRSSVRSVGTRPSACRWPLGREGRRKKGDRLPTPKAMLADDRRWPVQDLVIAFPKGKRRLQVKVVKDVCWYQAAGSQPVQLILVRDPKGEWRDEALLSTDQTLTPKKSSPVTAAAGPWRWPFVTANRCWVSTIRKCGARSRSSVLRRCRGSLVRWWSCGM